jgi:hypothetical protein
LSGFSLQASARRAVMSIHVPLRACEIGPGHFRARRHDGSHRAAWLILLGAPMSGFCPLLAGAAVPAATTAATSPTTLIGLASA